MFHPRCRGLAVGTAVLVVLMGSRAADAQHAPPREPGGVIHNLASGASFEIVDMKKAESRLQHLDAKLQRHTAHGNMAAAQHDVQKIRRTRFRLGVDEWLLRYNTCQQLGPYPRPLELDPITCAALAHYHGPAFTP